jgi:selenocysteine lyase/cysteine desulfurase
VAAGRDVRAGTLDHIMQEGSKGMVSLTIHFHSTCGQVTNAIVNWQVHARSSQRHKWLVVLDAAAHAPTHSLDLSKQKPDFVPLSFYKLFGLPTGEGTILTP